jgi:hypothetical protein
VPVYILLRRLEERGLVCTWESFLKMPSWRDNTNNQDRSKGMAWSRIDKAVVAFSQADSASRDGLPSSSFTASGQFHVPLQLPHAAIRAPPPISHHRLRMIAIVSCLELPLAVGAAGSRPLSPL